MFCKDSVKTVSYDELSGGIKNFFLYEKNRDVSPVFFRFVPQAFGGLRPVMVRRFAEIFLGRYTLRQCWACKALFCPSAADQQQPVTACNRNKGFRWCVGEATLLQKGPSPTNI